MKVFTLSALALALVGLSSSASAQSVIVDGVLSAGDPTLLDPSA